MAGLLDALFDPSMYGGPGGLLSRLGPMTGQFPQSAGFPQSSSFGDRFNALPNDAPPMATPMNVGGYQMPRLGSEAQFAAVPQNAQPAQGQMPPHVANANAQMPAQEQQTLPTFLNNGGGFGAGARGFVNNLHNGPLGALIGGIGGALGVRDQSQMDARALFDAYKAAGLDAPKAMLAVMNPKLAENMLGLGGTDDIKEYQFAKRENPSLTFEKFMQQKKAVSGEYSLNPVYGTDKNGNTVLMQTGKNGEAIQTKLPDGVKVSSGIEKVDLGTHWALYDKKSGVPLGIQPKDLQGKEAAEERGKQQGQAQASLPGAIADAEATKIKIDQLLENKGLDSIVGPIDQYRPTWTLGQQGNDALARYNQLKGTAFLQAYGLLRGGGAITDIEGKKAESAMARLDRAQSEEDFKLALKDFRDAIDAGVNKLKQRAGGGQQSGAPPNLKQKYGLD